MGQVTPVRTAVICKECGKALQTVPLMRENGQVTIDLVCPTHGRLPRGERFLTGYVSAVRT